jgi:formylglycine-generating enzyme
MQLNAHHPTLVAVITLLGSMLGYAQLHQESIATPEQKTATVPAQKAGPKPGEVLENPKDGLKYVWIPPGIFTMGCSPGDDECFGWERPAHEVTLSKGFWIGQTEVTVGAYQRFAAATGRQMGSAPGFNAGWANQNMPIVNVSWDESLVYCQWSGGRLPTEAEWEYAARAGSPEPRYGLRDDIAWYGDNSGRQHLDSDALWKKDEAARGNWIVPRKTPRKADYFRQISENGNGAHEVGQKRANGLGLHDTIGNVWEWVNDWQEENYYQNSPSSDPQGPTNGTSRVARGGAWYTTPGFVRVSVRTWNVPSLRNDSYGLRCASDVSPTPLHSAQQNFLATPLPAYG